MKKIKLLASVATVATFGSIVPLITLTNCGGGDGIIEGKEQTCENSFSTYTAQLNKKPKDNKVKVKIVNSSESQDQLSLYSSSSTNASSKEIEVTVGEDKKVPVMVKMDEPPVDSSESSFGLEYSYTDESGNPQTQKVDGCKYKYNIADKYVDLSNGSYTPKITPRTSWTDRESFISEYTNEVLNNDTKILAQDMYYSVAKHVSTAKQKESGQAGYLHPDSTIKIYLNDIGVYPTGGIWLRVNFHIESKEFTPFQVSDGTFKDVNATFQITLDSGYDITLSELKDQLNAWNINVSTHTQQGEKLSHGRFKGSFKLSRNGQNYTVDNYDGIINYESAVEAKTNPINLSSNFACGGMAWIFNAASASGYAMNYYSYYSKNLVDASPIGTVTIDGNEVEFTDLQQCKLCCADDDPIVLGGQSYPRAEFNYPINFKKKLIEIPHSFLSGCTAFNQEINFEDGCELRDVGAQFMSGCKSFNRGVTLPDSVISIGANFMRLGSEQSKTFSFKIPANVQEIGDWFMGGETNYNGQIIFTSCTKLTKIGEAFMYGCTSWNNDSNELVLPDTVVEINNGFLTSTNYDSNLTLPKSVQRIGGEILSNVPNFKDWVLTIKCSIDAFPEYSGTDLSFACECEASDDYEIKINIQAETPFTLDDFRMKYPNIPTGEHTTKEYVRKIILSE